MAAKHRRYLFLLYRHCRRATHKESGADEKIRIVLEGLRGNTHEAGKDGAENQQTKAVAHVEPPHRLTPPLSQSLYQITPLIGSRTLTTGNHKTRHTVRNLHL